VGYKIGLELIVKCNCQHVVEVPIHFAERAAGKSKLGLQQRLQYLEHVRRLRRHLRTLATRTPELSREAR
jgi:dolichol-phosphate mannosyltransferase